VKKPYRVQRFGHSHCVIVPKAIFDKLKWKPGTEVFIDEIDGRVVITDAERRVKELLEVRIRLQIDQHRAKTA
jgi:antitoxin component of MazEF toxin-antitoxin module